MELQNRVAVFCVMALLASLTLCFLMTPLVKSFAYKVGAIDIPKDNRRMHKEPVPRLGGLAIFSGFMAGVLLFADIPGNRQLQSILLGAVVIVVLGVVDDIMDLPALLKFAVQICAALIPATQGVVIQAFSNPNIFSDHLYWVLGNLSLPFTVLWIVAITNAVNLIDGLDGLANGVSAISAATVLIIALMGDQAEVAVVMSALVGACVGFMPYNMNPAKMFMGDTGATFLGFILACMSIQGLFKFYAIISFAVPFLILGLPIFDTVFAFTRRIAHGQSPMKADRGHIHHRLIDMGLNQKQAVATLYLISAILGLSAVVLTSGGEQRAMLFFAATCVVGAVAARVIFPLETQHDVSENKSQNVSINASKDIKTKNKNIKNLEIRNPAGLNGLKNTDMTDLPETELPEKSKSKAKTETLSESESESELEASKALPKSQKKQKKKSGKSSGASSQNHPKSKSKSKKHRRNRSTGRKSRSGR